MRGSGLYMCKSLPLCVEAWVRHQAVNESRLECAGRRREITSVCEGLGQESLWREGESR